MAGRLKQRQTTTAKTKYTMVYRYAAFALTAIIIAFIAVFLANNVFNADEAKAECPTGQGDQVSYGNDSWIGYVYDGAQNFSSSNYQGYIIETEIFDESFCGNNCDFATNGCNVNSETFSVRFKMRKTFAAGYYSITIGGDDGVRLSIDGGSTYAINGYNYQGYTTYNETVYLDGSHDMVFEFFEGGGHNRVSFSYTYLFESIPGDETAYGEGSWIGHVYEGANNFQSSNYRGDIFEDEIFDESFGGSNTTFVTSGASIQTETFSVRFKMRKTFAHGDYIFRIGADDGVRLSIDGGNTYLINDYSDHGYRNRDSEQVTLNGEYDLVLDFYENGGGNRVTFEYEVSALLPVSLIHFDGQAENTKVVLNWATASEENNDYFIVERSADGKEFQNVGKIAGNGTTTTRNNYSFTDNNATDALNYYRLKQVDVDGKYTYSEVIAVRVSKFQQENLTLYPNPVQDVLNISYQGNTVSLLVVEVINSRGEVVKTQEANDFTGTLSMDLSDLEMGIYIVRFNADKQVINKRIVVK